VAVPSVCLVLSLPSVHKSEQTGLIDCHEIHDSASISYPLSTEKS